MLTQMQGIPPGDTYASLTSSYAIGPIDPAELITLQVRLSQGCQICLLVPADPAFKDGADWGYLQGSLQEEWAIPRLVNDISLALHTEFLGARSPDMSTWIVGFLLGDLAKLAETERTLALVGIAHLSFLLSHLLPASPSCSSPHHWGVVEALHKRAVQSYRARVHLYRAQGASWRDAQLLALVQNF